MVTNVSMRISMYYDGKAEFEKDVTGLMTISLKTNFYN